MSELFWNKDFALSQVDHDQELLEELLAIFQDSSASDMALLLRAVETDDAIAARGASHSLKGAAASLGLEAIRDVAMLIEQDCRDGSLAVAREKLPQLESLMTQLREL